MTFPINVLFEAPLIPSMWKTGDNKISDAKKITIIPIIFITKPALSKSLLLIFPFTNIIALGGVATNRNWVGSCLKDNTYQLVTWTTVKQPYTMVKWDVQGEYLLFLPKNTSYKNSKSIIFLTTLSKMGNRMLAQARLLVNSVNTALIIITTRMIAVWGAPTIKWRKAAIVLDRSDTYNNNHK